MKYLIFLFLLTCLKTFANGPVNFAPKYPNFISPSSKSYFIQHNDAEIFQVKVLKTKEDLAKGFSGIKSEQVGAHQGLFFWFSDDELRHFWMPNTFFNLMIIFLNKDLVVTNIVKDAPMHPGMDEKKNKIYRAPVVNAKYVMELKSESDLAKNIEVGSRFKWIKGQP